jgi:hypothetical protein
MNGPGRDYYGNFALQAVDVEVGPAVDKLSPVALRGTLTDAPSVETNDTVISVNKKQLWRAQVGGAERLRRQLVLLPEKPFDGGGVIRFNIRQSSDIAGQVLGHFRLSITTAGDPGQVVGIPFSLRPLIEPGTDRQAGQAQSGAVRGTTPDDALVPDPAQPRLSPKQQLRRQWQQVAPELATVRDKIADLQSQIRNLKIPTAPVLSENPKNERPSTNLRIRGSFTNKGEELFANVPSFLGTLPAGVPANRLGLARWLVSRDNPLTARVRVNQIWQAYFGKGIVETSEDVGTQGAAPSHSELLDWLAVDFAKKGWDQKALHRLIVTSNTYRQSSSATRELLERDPSNTLLARGPRFRVEAEMVRDIVLEASGLMSHKIGGPPVMPYQPEGLWVFPFQPKDDKWTVSEGEDRHRRGLYTFTRRTARYPSLVVFDAPSRESSAARRPNTDTPLQALTTLNDPTFVEAAQAMAQRIVRDGGTDARSRAIYGFRLVTSRPPDQAELQRLQSGFERELVYFKSHLEEAKAVAGQSNAEPAAWTMISKE